MTDDNISAPDSGAYSHAMVNDKQSAFPPPPDGFGPEGGIAVDEDRPAAKPAVLPEDDADLADEAPGRPANAT